MLSKVKTIIASGVAFAPLAALAQAGTYRNLESAFENIIRIVNSYVIPFIIGIAVIYFMIGLIKYITKAGDEGARTEARNTMLWGVIIIFVMTAIWGLVNVLGDTLGLDKSIPNLPDVPEVNPGDPTRSR